MIPYSSSATRYISTRLSTVLVKVAIALFRAIRWLKRSLQYGAGAIWDALSPVGRVCIRIIILPVYRLIVLSRLRIQKLALPTRGVLLFVMTNRYLLHAGIGVIALITIISNLQTRQVHAQDVGQHSVLFAMATDEYSDVIEETIRPEMFDQPSSYLSSATVVGIPHIDFDYDEETESSLPTSLAVPGAIVAEPIETQGEAPRVPRNKTENYVVKENDTIGSIANHFGVNVGTILWNNHLTEREYIRPGDVLKIPQVSGILVSIKNGDTFGKLAARYDIDADEIAAANHLSTTDQLTIGVELVIPGARPPELEQTRTQIVARGIQRTPSGIPESVIPRGSATKPADVDTSALPTQRFVWPTSGHVITQYYGWRHTGVDIDGDYSSPIYAAGDGVVEKAGWNSGGYGLMILIDHGNGTKTRYGHSSKMFVKAGDKVKRGQVISMMGTTGRSTGTHLHFEIYVRGKRTNPLVYIR